MAFPTYDANHQDQIALRLTNRLYANLQTEEKTAIDGAWTTGSLTEGHAFESQILLIRYANFLHVTDPDANLPADWESWFIWETVARAAHHMRPEMASDAMKQRNDAMRQAVATYTKTDHDESSSTEGWVIDHQNIRNQVLDRCVHLEPLLLPSPERIDAAMRSRFVRLWNLADWSFKREQVNLTISTAGAVTDDASQDVDKILSKRLWYSDTDGTGQPLKSASATEMAYLKSLNTSAGRPQFFRTLKSGSDLSWEFDRTPDQAYTVKAEVGLETPVLATKANFDTALALLPVDVLDAYVQGVIADVVFEYGHKTGIQLRKEAMERWQAMTATDDVGTHDEVAAESFSRGTVINLMEGQHHYHNHLGGYV